MFHNKGGVIFPIVILVSSILVMQQIMIMHVVYASPSSCQALPNDGRPQPQKGANADPDTWKVVPMRDDPSLFKVVDSAGINVADRFHSRTNAEQYVAHYVCVSSPPPSPTPPTPPLPTESTPDMPDYDAGNPPEPPELPICTYPVPTEVPCKEAPPSERPGATIYCNSGTTCYGTDGNDSIQGSIVGDRIESLSGNDKILGGGGNDVIRSGRGNDIVYGDDGDDDIDAGADNDKIYGGYGVNTLRGNSGHDSIEGGDNRDIIYGGAEFDTSYGYGGNDDIYQGFSGKRTNTGQEPSPSSPDGSADLIYCGPGDDKAWEADSSVVGSDEPTGDYSYGCEVINGNRLGSP